MRVWLEGYCFDACHAAVILGSFQWMCWSALPLHSVQSLIRNNKTYPVILICFHYYCTNYVFKYTQQQWSEAETWNRILFTVKHWKRGNTSLKRATFPSVQHLLFFEQQSVNIWALRRAAAWLVVPFLPVEDSSTWTYLWSYAITVALACGIAEILKAFPEKDNVYTEAYVALKLVYTF